jgi:hypothetical protein
METRTEKKYVLDAVHAPLAGAVIGAHCLPDPNFARATVHSIYFDTLDLQLLTEKIDSTYLKAKVRLRWYGSWDFLPDDGPAFLEAKIKEGGLERKVRMRVPLGGRDIAAMPLDAPELSALPALLAGHGVGLTASVRPVFVISYRRMRFVDPRTGTRIALDQDIRAPRLGLSCPGPGAATALPFAVVETKGSIDSLPPFLAPLVAMGLQPESFSKYLHCYRAIMQQPM